MEAELPSALKMQLFYLLSSYSKVLSPSFQNRPTLLNFVLSPTIGIRICNTLLINHN